MRLLVLLSFFVLVACSPQTDQEGQVLGVKHAEIDRSETILETPFSNTGDKLDPYWYQGLGEINVYNLQQNRYKDIYDGQVVLIFVTEDFLTDKQVKNEQGKKNHSASVLKLNAINRFTTGIYDYSLMTSVFTPVQTSKWPATMKVTNTGQDWCGQVYSQVNLNKNGEYRQILHSYFEKEGDQENTSTADLLEDEIFNRIRMGWENLPEGKNNIIPSMNFLRLKHQPYAAYSATLSLSDYTGTEIKSDEPLKVYRIEYPEFDRVLDIVFQAKSPYIIEGWKDSYPSVFDQKIRSSIAIRQKTILDNYWSHHSPQDAKMRENLGL